MGDILNEVEQLVDLVADSRVTELTVQSGGRRLTIKRPAHARRPAAPTLSALIGESPDHEETEPVETTPQPPEHKYIIAPMVGVYHAAAQPVGPGTTLDKGQLVGAIESMKLMNDVLAEEVGVVSHVLIEDGHAVEYGQPLFELEEKPNEDTQSF